MKSLDRLYSVRIQSQLSQPTKLDMINFFNDSTSPVLFLVNVELQNEMNLDYQRPI